MGKRVVMCLWMEVGGMWWGGGAGWQGRLPLRWQRSLTVNGIAANASEA